MTMPSASCACAAGLGWIVAAAALAGLGAPCAAQGFVLSPKVHPTGSSIFADETGLYLPCLVREPGTGAPRWLPIVHFDGTKFRTLGSGQIAATREPAGGEAVARGADGSILLRGRFDVEGWPASCLAARADGMWKVVVRDDLNPYELVAVGGKIFAAGYQPKAAPRSLSGLFRVDARTAAWTDVGMMMRGVGKPQPGQVGEIVVAGSKMYVAGHFNVVGGRDCRDIVEFDSATDTWTAIEPPYPPAPINALGAPGEPIGTSKAFLATPNGTAFWIGTHRKMFGHQDQAIAVRERGAWRMLGKIESDEGQLHSLKLVASGNAVYAVGSFGTLLGEKCEGFALWDGARFVAAGKQRGIWSVPAPPSTDPLRQWTVRDRQIIDVTGGWPGKIVVVARDEAARKTQPLAIFDVGSGAWMEIRSGLED